MNELMTEAIKRHCKKHKYSDSYRDYWQLHPFCEICGYHSDPPHHKKSRGSGGDDSSDNLISLCTAHHREVHNLGRISFMNKYGLDKE